MSGNLPLQGIKIIDFTHVQAGPACTQLLAWFGADVIKVERAGEGDITRGQLRDIPDVDSLYFTMLNHNKRSITVNTKSADGKKVLEDLIAANLGSLFPGKIVREAYAFRITRDPDLAVHDPHPDAAQRASVDLDLALDVDRRAERHPAGDRRPLALERSGQRSARPEKP